MGRGGVRWGWWGAAADRLDVDVGDDELVGGEAEAVLDVPLRVPPKHRHADDLRAARTHHTARRTTRAPHAAHRAPHTARTQKGFNQRGHPGMTYVPTMPALCPIPQRGREGEGIGGIEREGKGKGRGGAGWVVGWVGGGGGGGGAPILVEVVEGGGGDGAVHPRSDRLARVPDEVGHLRVRVRVRACVRASACACVRARACVCASLFFARARACDRGPSVVTRWNGKRASRAAMGERGRAGV